MSTGWVALRSNAARIAVELLSTETTFGGRGDLVGQGTGAIMSYGDLIFTTLTRARTAREAIEVMDQLCQVRPSPRLSFAPCGDASLLALPALVNFSRAAPAPL